MEFTGYHRLEKDLWDDGLQADSPSIADQLLADVTELVGKAKAVELNPLQLANGSKALLDEIATGKITGEEERYSHTDLWDFDANFEGSVGRDPGPAPLPPGQGPARSSPRIDERGAALDELLDSHHDGDGFVLYPALTPAEVKALTEALDAFARAGLDGRRRGRRGMSASIAPRGARRRCRCGPGRGRRQARPMPPPPGPVQAARSRPRRRTTVSSPSAGAHQAGITTAAQDRLHFVALDVITDDPAELRDLLTRWTVAAERMTAGAEAAPGGIVGGGPWKVPEDTGEALDLAPGHLTVTIGYGPSLFDDRFGLADRRPEALRELPGIRRRRPRPGALRWRPRIQACSDDPQVAVHAVRNLVRMGFGVVSVRWSQLGFGRTSSTSRSQLTPRNMFGFKDGTANITAEDADGLDRARVGRARRRSRGRRVDGGGLLPRGPADPDAHRGLGPHPAHGAGADHRARQAGSGRRSGRATSSTSPTSPRRASTASRGSR